MVYYDDHPYNHEDNEPSKLVVYALKPGDDRKLREWDDQHWELKPKTRTYPLRERFLSTVATWITCTTYIAVLLVAAHYAPDPAPSELDATQFAVLEYCLAAFPIVFLLVCFMTRQKRSEDS
jgi:hypothetical protein